MDARVRFGRQIRRAAALDHIGKQRCALEGFGNAARNSSRPLPGSRRTARRRRPPGIARPAAKPHRAPRRIAQRFERRGERHGSAGHRRRRGSWQPHRPAGMTRRNSVWPHFLGEFLILELDAGGAGGGTPTAHRAVDIQQPAIAGVAVSQETERLVAPAIAAHTIEHFGEGCGAGIGYAQRRGDDAISGHVKRIETNACRHSRRDAVKDARKRQTSIALQQRTKRCCPSQAVLPSFSSAAACLKASAIIVFQTWSFRLGLPGTPAPRCAKPSPSIPRGYLAKSNISVPVLTFV